MQPFQARHASWKNSIRSYKPKYFGQDGIKSPLDPGELKQQMPKEVQLLPDPSPDRITIIQKQRIPNKLLNSESRNILRDISQESIKLPMENKQQTE